MGIVYKDDALLPWFGLHMVPKQEIELGICLSNEVSTYFIRILAVASIRVENSSLSR